MYLTLGRVKARVQEASTAKFAWPLVLIPELFATSTHLSLLTGYLASIGWRVFALDLYAAAAPQATFEELLRLALEAISTIDSEVILMGHGLGGLIALKLAGEASIRAGIALAPIVPGFRSLLVSDLRNRIAERFGRPLRPPSGRTLFEFIADADPFHREALIKDFEHGTSAVMNEIAKGRVQCAKNAAPRLIITGDSDIFAPHELVSAFAGSLMTPLVTLKGRGHWIVGGRALERVVAEVQRFLVKALGQDLLLLYPEN
jgi:pimeloyl-ACP methyl ester carboxylesterase